MTARFELEVSRGADRPVLVLEPDHGNEAILFATFMRYDANAFSVRVERSEDGQVRVVRLYACDAE